MKKTKLFTKILCLIAGCCIMLTALSTLAFYYFGMRVFGSEIQHELFPRARNIANVAERYFEGHINYDTFDFLIATVQSRESSIYIFDDQGNLFSQSKRPGYVPQNPPEACAGYASRILASGNQISETNWKKAGGVLVGLPVFDNLGRVVGAVIVLKPLVQIRNGMRSITLVLIAACCTVMVLLAGFAYLISRRITNPIIEMTEIAEKMATGDFSARVKTNSGAPEITGLGLSLNFMASELSASVSELISAKNKLNMILTSVNEGILTLNASEYSITYFNPAAAKILDLSVFPPKPGCEGWNEMNRCFQQLADSEDSDPAIMYLSQNERKLKLTINRTDDPGGFSGDMIVLVQDITEAERLEQTRRDYVANVSHELRTPIAAVRSLAETLNDGLIKNEDEKGHYYYQILRESTRLSRLVDDLLELSRLQSGSVALLKNEFSLSDLLCRVCERMAIIAEYSDITLMYEGCPDSRVFSNMDRIEQITVCLIDNAIKYSDDDGTIIVKAEDSGSYLSVSVENTGHVAESDLPHLFERFYKADKSHAESGTGLGLSIAKEIITLLNEDITVQNGMNHTVVFTYTVHKE